MTRRIWNSISMSTPCNPSLQCYLDSLSGHLFSNCQSCVQFPRESSQWHTSGPQWSPPKTTMLKEDIMQYMKRNDWLNWPCQELSEYKGGWISRYNPANSDIGARWHKPNHRRRLFTVTSMKIYHSFTCFSFVLPLILESCSLFLSLHLWCGLSWLSTASNSFVYLDNVDDSSDY